MPSPAKVVHFVAQIQIRVQKKRKVEKEADKLADIETKLNDIRKKEPAIEKIARDDLCGVGSGVNSDQLLVVKGSDGKYKECGISGEDIDISTSDEIEVANFDGTLEEAAVWNGMTHPSNVAGDRNKVHFVRSFLILFSLLIEFPKKFVERALSRLFPLLDLNYRHVTVARIADDEWRDSLCKILKRGISISHLDVIESARKIDKEKLNEAIDSFLSDLYDQITFIEKVKSIAREVANCSKSLGYSEEKSCEMQEKLNEIPAATRKIREVHRRWTKEGGPAPDSDSMIEKVLSAHRSNVEKKCASVEERAADCAEVVIVFELTTQFIDSLKTSMVIRVSNDPAVDDLPSITLMATLSPSQTGVLVEPSYLSILAVKDGNDLPNLIKDKKVFVEGFDHPSITELISIVEPELTKVYSSAEEIDKWRDYIKEIFRKRNNLT